MAIRQSVQLSWHKTVDLREDETMENVLPTRLANDDGGAKVFLAGSIFGGTGASGFPTIAQLIKEATC